MPIAGGAFSAADPPDGAALGTHERYQRFSEIREGLLIGYKFNTARAYWSDLDDIFWWAERRGFEVTDLPELQFRQYVALLRRRKYSENTIRRRRIAYQHLQNEARSISTKPDGR